ncbi:ATP-binding protein [Acetatifactor aquisgranensis]|uniref:ATP-binding protein n=1 Tax=Acetatifactor aquisgranensis TaxID=2941233 RepID=UPI00203AF32B|nr:ATP-binding protein [Acetatifactor aquisgranensis]MCI8541710.1 ATP-binding protein [Lachnospiraceae bacterium]
MALSNSQYEAIIKGYQRTRDENRILAETRRQKVYETVPEYRRLEESISTLSVAGARRMLGGDENALARLHEELAEVTARQKCLLAEHGFPADYLEPLYRCADCQDTGYITSGNGLREKCHCFRQQEISILYAQSHIQDTIERENFSTLSYAYYRDDDLRRFETAVDISRKFIKDFRENYQNLFFYGTVGTGKSFLSGCIAGELLKNGNSVIYFSASGLFDTLARYTFDGRLKDSLHDLCEDLYSCDLLIIDDLGTEITNSFVTSELFSCLNERHLRGKSTLISTNISLEELRDRYSDRIFSRITSGFTLCKLTGPDIRILKKRLSNAAAT